MTDLQIGLLILGLFIIGGVVAFNWLQERQFHQRAQQGFQRPDADLLLNNTDRDADVRRSRDDPGQRIDPRLDPDLEDSDNVNIPEEMLQSVATEIAVEDIDSEQEREKPGVEQLAAEGLSSADSTVPSMAIGFVAEIRAGESIPKATIDTLEQTLKSFGRRYELRGFNYHSRQWEFVSDPSVWYTSIRIFMQLVDRSGAVQRDQLELVSEVVAEQADLISGIAEVPELDSVMSDAATLDEFCVDVDVIVSLSVVAQTGQAFHGTQLRALAEANGLRLQPNGVFVLPDAHNGALFTLDNQESNPFRADQLKQLTTRGVSFLLDVPCTSNGLRVFDKMVSISRKFAESLDGTLCDDNRIALNDDGIEKIRAQLRTIYSNMESHGIPAGSTTARHLFS